MKSKKIGKCYICGTEFDTNTDYCPLCCWWYLGYEDKLEEDEIEPTNSTSIVSAKENYKKGLDKYGRPLPNIKHKDTK